MTTVAVGAQAPDFSLTSHDGGVFTLSEALKKGPVVLIFYIADELPNCDRLLCQINDDVTAFASRGATVVGLNNLSVEHHRRYAERRFMKLPLLADIDCRVAQMYNSAFIIGPIKVTRYGVVGIKTTGEISYFERGRPSNQQIFAGMGLQNASSN